jgi:hypothetical protein
MTFLPIVGGFEQAAFGEVEPSRRTWQDKFENE